ncbi:MAG: hypothetical protein ABIE14_02725 [Patescibacteria group bacterium]
MFEFHRVEMLGAHVALLDGVSQFQQPVGERRLTVVDMGDDAKVTNVFHKGLSVNLIILALRSSAKRSEGRVVDMGDDAKVTNVFHFNN